MEGAELLVTAAYASLGADDWSNATHTTNWLYGSVRSDDAYKGGGSTADQVIWIATNDLLSFLQT